MLTDTRRRRIDDGHPTCMTTNAKMEATTNKVKLCISNCTFVCWLHNKKVSASHETAPIIIFLTPGNHFFLFAYSAWHKSITSQVKTQQSQSTLLNNSLFFQLFVNTQLSSTCGEPRTQINVNLGF